MRLPGIGDLATPEWVTAAEEAQRLADDVAEFEAMVQEMAEHYGQPPAPQPRRPWGAVNPKPTPEGVIPF